MPTKLCKWGNSAGLRLGRQIVESAALRIGDMVFIRLLDSGDILIRAERPRESPAGYVSGDSLPMVESTVTVEEKW